MTEYLLQGLYVVVGIVAIDNRSSSSSNSWRGVMMLRARDDRRSIAGGRSGQRRLQAVSRGTND